jgi:hypothetical protein
MFARWVAASVYRTLVCEAALTLEEKLDPLAAALLALW